MRGDVPADSVAENILAEKTLQHSQERLTFFVSDIIESAVCFRLGGNGLLNWMRRRSSVAFDRLLLGNTDTSGRTARQVPSQPHPQLRLALRVAFRAHH